MFPDYLQGFEQYHAIRIGASLLRKVVKVEQTVSGTRFIAAAAGHSIPFQVRLISSCQTAIKSFMRKRRYMEIR